MPIQMQLGCLCATVRVMRRLTLFWTVVALGACSTDEGAVDPDAAHANDAAPSDAGPLMRVSARRT